MAEFWISIAAGVLIVLLAVAIPFWLTHRRMRPHDLTEGQTYLDATGKTPEEAAVGRPGRRFPENGTPGKLPQVHPGGVDTQADRPS
jgi:hypothetical protein